jgi:hypothetical protein
VPRPWRIWTSDWISATEVRASGVNAICEVEPATGSPNARSMTSQSGDTSRSLMKPDPLSKLCQ